MLGSADSFNHPFGAGCLPSTEPFHFLMACSRVGRERMQIIHLLIFPFNPRHPRVILTFHMLHCFISTQVEHRHFKMVTTFLAGGSLPGLRGTPYMA